MDLEAGVSAAATGLNGVTEDLVAKLMRLSTELGCQAPCVLAGLSVFAFSSVEPACLNPRSQP